jgi:GR25 family glycosyltransferase involved in LPS biosynthesis
LFSNKFKKQAMENHTIPTFVINREIRTDRKQHILKEFQGRDEFNVSIVVAREHKIGAVGLWNSIKHILANLVSADEDYILICEDDHLFTESYSKEKLFSAIDYSVKLNRDILCGGISWLDCALPESEGLFWVRAFTGTQFLIIFRSLFSKILESDFNPEQSQVTTTVNSGDLAISNLVGFKLCSLTDRKIFMYPFISIQKDFGYSDVTGDTAVGIVEQLFDAAKVKVESTIRILSYYKSRPALQSSFNINSNAVIPTFIINLRERTERRAHILNEFKDRSEFSINVIDAYKHEIGAVGLWMTMRKIISMAIANDEDFILICEDDHVFTEHYTKEYLFKNIVQAQMYGANILSGGAGYFGLAVPVTQNTYWVNPAGCTQFTIVFKKFYKKILDTPYDDTVMADMFLSEMTSNRMVIYPYISIQKDFGYSDATSLHNRISVTTVFEQCSRRLGDIQRVRSISNV